MTYVIVALLLVLLTSCGLLLLRSTRRLLQFDSIFAEIVPSLESYSRDLKKMAAGDLLIDNPEVLAFHRRNLRALKELNSTISALTAERPKRVKKQPLPRPDVV